MHVHHKMFINENTLFKQYFIPDVKYYLHNRCKLNGIIVIYHEFLKYMYIKRGDCIHVLPVGNNI